METHSFPPRGSILDYRRSGGSREQNYPEFSLPSAVWGHLKQSEGLGAISSETRLESSWVRGTENWKEEAGVECCAQVQRVNAEVAVIKTSVSGPVPSAGCRSCQGTLVAGTDQPSSL